MQRRLKPVKVGHAGTLDPLASGVLTLMIGKATRLTEYVQMMPKTYAGQFRFGASSDTEDIEGNVLELPSPPKPKREEIENVLPRFVGVIEQMPPIYSALKVKGKRAYSLARSGEKVELQARPIEVYSLALTNYDYPNIELMISCGSGTYIRSLGRDIARSLGTEAVMTALTRTAIGSFALEDSVDSNLLSGADLEAHLLPMRKATAFLREMPVSVEALDRLRYGLCIDSPDANGSIGVPATESGQQSPEIAAIAPDGELAAILVKATKRLGAK